MFPGGNIDLARRRPLTASPQVRGLDRWVELRGLEPLTPTLPVRFSRRVGTCSHLRLERKRAGHRLGKECSAVVGGDPESSDESASLVPPVGTPSGGCRSPALPRTLGRYYRCQCGSCATHREKPSRSD